ncbi:MAG: MFS transporter [Geminicoccales bacterium]
MSSKAPNPRTALAVGCTAHVVQDGLTAATYVLMPVLAQTFGFTYAQVGLIKGLKSLTQAVLEIYSGVLSERIGEGRTLVFGLILSGIGYASVAAAPDPMLIAACLLIVGAGTAFQHSPSSALVSTAYAEGGRRGALGLYNSSGDVGKLAFSGMFSLAIGAGFAWQHISFFLGFLTLLAAAGVAIAARHLKARSAHSAARSEDCDPDESLGWGVLNWRSFGTLLVIISLDNVVQAGVLVFIAFLMIAKGLPLYVATMATVVLLTGGIFGKAGCGYLAERIGVCRAFVLVQVLTALGLISVIMAPAWLAFALLLPLGVVAQGSTSITYGLIPDLIHPRRMARGYAIMYSSTSFAAALGPWLFGLIGDQYGINVAVQAMAVVALLAVPPIAFLPAFREVGRRSV